MAYDSIETTVNRRRFLKAAAATALAATAAGSGAALLMEKKNQAPTFVPPPSLPEPVNLASEVSENASELFSRLAQAQAENVRLQAELAITKNQLEAARGLESSENKAVVDAFETQLNEANTQVETLSGQVSVLTGLVTLYEQLDDIDLGNVIEEGLDSVDTVLDGLFEKIPSATEGLQIGQQALTEFEEQIPLIEEGRKWLASQMDRLGVFYGMVELALEEAVDGASTFLNMLSEWFQNVLKWLPFGIGKPAAAVMEAMTELLGEIPGTLGGLNDNVVQPLDIWFEKDGEETQLHRRLIKPVREKALSQAEETINEANSLQSVFETQLREPTKLAAKHQQALREQIDAYRNTYQV
jgi:hypothetical protein